MVFFTNPICGLLEDFKIKKRALKFLNYFYQIYTAIFDKLKNNNKKIFSSKDCAKHQFVLKRRIQGIEKYSIAEPYNRVLQNSGKPRISEQFGRKTFFF